MEDVLLRDAGRREGAGGEALREEVGEGAADPDVDGEALEAPEAEEEDAVRDLGADAAQGEQLLPRLVRRQLGKARRPPPPRRAGKGLSGAANVVGPVARVQGREVGVG